MEDDEPLPAQAGPAPPTQPQPSQPPHTISAPVVHPRQEIPLRCPYRLHPNRPLLMNTSRKTVRAPFVLPPTIKAAISEEIAAPPRKRCRSPSPPPLPSSSSTSSSPSPLPAMLPHHKRFRMTSPHQDTTAKGMTKAINPARLCRRSAAHRWVIVHHEDQIYVMQDHMKELPLERFEAIKHDIEGLHDVMTSEQDVETVQTTLGIVHERILTWSSA
ncbi:hypothetical protein Tco_0421471 [Tanacetum coccineum]